MTMQQTTRNKSSRQIAKRNKLLFYIAVMALPVLQFIIFWICVNVNSIKLAFQTWNFDTKTFEWYGLNNFAKVLEDIKTVPSLKASLENSLLIYAFTLLLGTPLSLIFSFYLYKQRALSGTFKTILYLPHILSSLIVVVLFKYFVNRAIPNIYESITGEVMQGLLANTKTELGTVIFFNIWTGFGTSTMMYLGAMNGISDSVVEAAELDGITPLKEMSYITIPLIWPTFVTFIVVGFAAMFTTQANLFNFYGLNAPPKMNTFGYYLYVKAKEAVFNDYPYLAAMGICLSLVAAPCTILLRKGLEKLGPKTK
jgi:ABC-type sugar transport system permease subunit